MQACFFANAATAELDFADTDSPSGVEDGMTISNGGSELPPGPPPIPTSCFLPALRSGFCAERGQRKSMEDTCVVLDDISSLTPSSLLCQPQAFYGVFDGHGGSDAARYLQSNLLGNLTTDKDFPLRIKSALVNAFLRTDLELGNLWEKERSEPDSGSTALAAVVWGRMLYVANAGDCRAVMSRRGRAVDLTRDHRTDSKLEKERVVAAGGHIIDEYLNDKLAVTRALGDWHMEDLKRRTMSDGSTTTSGPLIAEPEVFESPLTEGDEFLVLACDGLWDAFNGQSQDVISFTRRHLRLHNDPYLSSKDLVSEALRKDAGDNITVVTICFSGQPPCDLRHSRKGAERGEGAGRGSTTMRRSISVEAFKSLQGCISDA